MAWSDTAHQRQTTFTRPHIQWMEQEETPYSVLTPFSSTRKHKWKWCKGSLLTLLNICLDTNSQNTNTSTMWWGLSASAEAWSLLGLFFLWPGNSLFHLPEKVISAGLSILTAETKGLTPAFTDCSWCRGYNPLWSELDWNLAGFLVPCFRVGSAPAYDLKPRQSHIISDPRRHLNL